MDNIILKGWHGAQCNIGEKGEPGPIGINVTAEDIKKCGIRVYIASAYTKGDIAINVRRQIDTYEILRNQGFYPFAPLYSHFQHMIHPRDYEDWMDIDFKWIEACDCLLRLDGESSGADREVEYAESIGIPVFYNIYDVFNHYAKLINHIPNV